MRAGKHALRAIVLTIILLGASGERARCCKSRQRDVPRLSRRARIRCAARRRSRCARCSCRRTSLPTACTARHCVASIATRRSPNCRIKTCQGRLPTRSGHGSLSTRIAAIATRRRRRVTWKPITARSPPWAMPMSPPVPTATAAMRSCRASNRGVERGAGQPVEDLPQLPCRRDAGLRDVPIARHDRRLCALSLCVDRLEIRHRRGRRRAGDLLDPFGALVLPRIARPPAAQAAAACARRGAAAPARAAISSAGARSGDGRTSVCASASSCWSPPACLCSIRTRPGRRCWNGHRRAGNRRHHPPGRRRGHGRGLCRAHRLCRHPHRAELEEPSKSSAPIR